MDKIVAGVIVLIGLVAGIAMYWLQVYAFYEPVRLHAGGTRSRWCRSAATCPRPIVVENVARDRRGQSSPLRFRACFTTPLTQATLTETYRALRQRRRRSIAPGWFDCFDADAIGAALERGEALAFLSQTRMATRGRPGRRGLSRWPGLRLAPV